MKIPDALMALSALSHETRLGVLRLLVRAGPDGLAAGQIAERIGALQNTMSTHLKVLSSSGLVDSERRSRSIVYRANYATIRELVLFLMEDCCAGEEQICNPVAQSLACRSQK